MKSNPYEQAPESLKRLLNKESMDSLLKNIQQTSPADRNDRGFWYSKSYPVFLQRFAETRSSNDTEAAWIERTAIVFSWIARIPVVRLDEQAIHSLAELERLFASSTLWKIGTESYLGGLNDPELGLHHGERIWGTGGGVPPVLLKDFIQLANGILNYGDTRLNFPTTTKLLHFMLPDLFPIFDANVCRAIFGNDRVEDYNKYHAYLFALQDYLEYDPSADAIFELAAQIKLPPLRIVDVVLFQDGINESKHG